MVGRRVTGFSSCRRSAWTAARTYTRRGKTVVLGIRKLLFKIVSRDEELADSKETADTKNAGNIIQRALVIYYDLSCDCNDKNLESISGG